MPNENEPRLAYLSGSSLYLHAGEGPPRRIESRFGERVRERTVRMRSRDAWKKSGTGAQFLSGGLWGVLSEDDDERIRIAIRGVSRGREPGELLYALDTDDVTGVFCLRHDGDEQRLFHSADLRVDHLAANPELERVACSVRGQAGTSHIAVMEADGSNLAEVTEGDSVDVAPSWVPSAERSLVYQSAGIGRDRDGEPVALAPFCVQRLRLEDGSIETLAQDPDCDLLTPRLDGQGNLYAIRRPHEKDASVSHWHALLDFLAFPFRLLFALFQYLNFFSAMYTGKPLSPGVPGRSGPELKRMVIWGNVIDAEKAARRGRLRGEVAPSLVPKTWELVRFAEGGAGDETVLARGVLSFDIGRDGSVVYSNGSAVERLAPSGELERVAIARRIEQVVWLD